MTIKWNELPAPTRESYIHRLLDAVPDSHHLDEIAQAMATQLARRCADCNYWDGTRYSERAHCAKLRTSTSAFFDCGFFAKTASARE